jgi:hypothetical protein
MFSRFDDLCSVGITLCSPTSAPLGEHTASSIILRAGTLALADAEAPCESPRLRIGFLPPSEATSSQPARNAQPYIQQSLESRSAALGAAKTLLNQAKL